MPPIDKKPINKKSKGSKDLNIESKLMDATKKRMRLEKIKSVLQKDEIKNAEKLVNLNKKLLNLDNDIVDSYKKINIEQSKIGKAGSFVVDSFLKPFIGLKGKALEFLAKELDVTHQINFLWERVRNGAELYARAQGSLPELTGKQISEMEKLQEQIEKGGISWQSAQAVMEATPGILKDATVAAKNLVKQQFLMANATRETALRYGETYEAVRDMQKTVQETLAIRVVDDATRKDIERVTDSLYYMKNRGIMPINDSLSIITELSRQFGSGTTEAVGDASKSLEKLARIPIKVSDNMQKAEGMVGRFAATNQEDFLRTILELNKAYGSQTTILANVGAAFAQLTMEARKYGAESESAVRIAKGLGSALVENQQDSHIAFLAGQRLVDKLQEQPALYEKMTSNMNEETKKTFDMLLKEGGLAPASVSKILASTTENMEERFNIIKDIYGNLDLSTLSRMLPSIPGLEGLKTEEEKLTVSRMIREETPEKIVSYINELSREAKKGGKGKEKEITTLEAVNTIAKPIQALATQWKGLKESTFVSAIENASDLFNDTSSETNNILRDIYDVVKDIQVGYGSISESVGTFANDFKAGLEPFENFGKDFKAGMETVSKPFDAFFAWLANDSIFSRFIETPKTAEEIKKETDKALKEGRGKDVLSTLPTEIHKNLKELGEKQNTPQKFLIKSLLASAIPGGTALLRGVEASMDYLSDKLVEAKKPENINRYDQASKVMVEMKETKVPKSSMTSTVNKVQAENIVLNPDGSATIRTVIDQKVHGFTSAVSNSMAQVESNKSYGER